MADPHADGPEFQEDNLTDWAAALTYYAVLSIFPALIVLVSIVGLVMDPAELTRALTDLVSTIGPETAADTFREPIESLTENRARTGALLVLGVAVGIWTASAWVGGFIRASNAIYEIEEGRPFLRLRPLQLLVTLVMVLMLALLLVALVLTGPVAEDAGNAIGVGDSALQIWHVAKWPVMLVAGLGMLAVVYYMAPNAQLPRFRLSHPAACWPCRCGCSPRLGSPSMLPTSAPTTRPMARSEA